MMGMSCVSGLARNCPTSPSSSDRKSTRLNSSHGYISYAVFCLKKKKNRAVPREPPIHIQKGAHPTGDGGAITLHAVSGVDEAIISGLPAAAHCIEDVKAIPEDACEIQ